MEASARRMMLQEILNFMGAVAAGIEEAVGDSANSITYLAGRKLGIEISEDAQRKDDIEEALAEAGAVLRRNGCLWMFEPFKPSKRESLIMETGRGKEIMLVFRDCMIRQALFTFGHHQKGSLCNLMFGFFSGALQNIMGKNSTLEIVHAGENACYKRLIIHP